jgi:hypothetical protein
VASTNAPALPGTAHNMYSTKHVSIGDTQVYRVSVAFDTHVPERPQRPAKPRGGHPRPMWVRLACMPSAYSTTARVGAVPVVEKTTTSSLRQPHRAVQEHQEGDAAAATNRAAARCHAHDDTTPAHCEGPASVAAHLHRTRAQAHAQSTRPHGRRVCSRAVREGARSIAALGLILKL